ncbi:MAG TPA: ComEC/Rec2 family competence protein, partial [Pyrinomonadaceae bacterium]|nr:ComEC/Rec2 family competence protein [Pyrinomonadaceae bacterium]
MKNPHLRLFSSHPLAQIAIAFSCGIISSTWFFRNTTLLIGCGCLSLVVVIALYKRYYIIAGISLLSAFVLAGALLATCETRPESADSIKHLLLAGVIDGDDTLELVGTLNTAPEFARDRAYMTLRVERLKAKGREMEASGIVQLAVFFHSAANETEFRGLRLPYGAQIRVKTDLNWSDKYRNPGVSSLTEFLDRNNYDATGVVKAAASITRLSEPSAFNPLVWLYEWRRLLQQEIDLHFNAETAGVLDAALLGNRYNLSKSTAQRFREGGTFHVLVISGLHISFLGSLVFLLMRKLSHRRLLPWLTSVAIVWIYTIGVGAEASVVRAAFMFTFVACGAIVFRRASSLNALGGAGLALLLWSPKGIFDPSLQLTFLSVLGIVVLAWPLLQTMSAIGSWYPTRLHPYPPVCAPWFRSVCELLFWREAEWRREIGRNPHSYKLFKTRLALWLESHHLQRILRYTFSAVLVSVSVQVVLLPVLVIYFHRVTFASAVLNIVVNFLLVALAGVALAALVMSQLSAAIAVPLCSLADGLNWLMVHSVDPFVRLGLASVRLPHYAGWLRVGYVLYYLPLLAIVVSLSRWHPLECSANNRNSRVGLIVIAALVQLGLLGLVIFHPISASRPDGKLHVDFLDVGQGDSALVTMPEGTTLLVDGGGRPNFFKMSAGQVDADRRSIGEAVVSEFLWEKGLDRVDYVLPTHADADHIDGLNDVLRNFSVRSALVARTPTADPEFAKFAAEAALQETPLEVIRAGDTLQFGSVSAKVLWPPAKDYANAPSQNNDSVVLRLQIGARALLLTGDIEKDAENAMLNSG